MIDSEFKSITLWETSTELPYSILLPEKFVLSLGMFDDIYLNMENPHFILKLTKHNCFNFICKKLGLLSPEYVLAIEPTNFSGIITIKGDLTNNIGYSYSWIAKISDYCRKNQIKDDYGIQGDFTLCSSNDDNARSYSWHEFTNSNPNLQLERFLDYYSIVKEEIKFAMDIFSKKQSQPQLQSEDDDEEHKDLEGSYATGFRPRRWS